MPAVTGSRRRGAKETAVSRGDAAAVAAALGAARRSGSWWRCRCPVHDSKAAHWLCATAIAISWSIVTAVVLAVMFSTHCAVEV